MVRIIYLFIAVLLFQDSFCQTSESVITYNHIDSLLGEWRGKFLDQTTSNIIPIDIIFKRKKKRIMVYSYTHIKTEVVICEVDYKVIGKDSIYLKESAIVKGSKIYNICFQTMNIQITPEENKLIMIGEWTTPGIVACGKGTIYLEKVP